MYALYAAYGFSQGDIGKLFIAGFGSSMVCGSGEESLPSPPHAPARCSAPWSARWATASASCWRCTRAATRPELSLLPSRSGRRSASLLYCATYAASCATKHWNNYGVLMVGRVLGGVATSLLFTAFESWLVSEHGCRGYDPAWLSGTFSRAVFLGNGLVAILSGLVANTLVTTAKLGPTAPFDAAAVALSCGGALIWFTWTENYGGGKSGGSAADKEAGGPPSPVTTDAFTSLKAQFRTAAAAISGDPRVGLLGAMQSLFEASMYSFVFLWTPALSPNGESIPHGFIFATFMLSSMIGSSLAARLLRPEAPVRPEVYMQAVFAASAACLAAPVLVAATGMGPSAGWAVKYGAFNAFEVCVGIFWPSMMKLRATYVPEDVRSTISASSRTFFFSLFRRFALTRA